MHVFMYVCKQTDSSGPMISLEISWVDPRTGATEKRVHDLTLPEKLGVGQRFSGDCAPGLGKAIALAEYVQLRNVLVTENKVVVVLLLLLLLPGCTN